jgi:methylmalonyl-CoA/ethylmalonyl-CoA epimerase
MLRFHHIGIFVRSIEEGNAHLGRIIATEVIGTVIKDDGLGVMVQFVSDTCGITYELVAPYGSNNPVDNVLKSRKNILNHIAYTSDSFAEDLGSLRLTGAIPLGQPMPAKAFGGKLVVFFLTKLGFIIELIEGETNER